MKRKSTRRRKTNRGFEMSNAQREVQISFAIAAIDSGLELLKDAILTKTRTKPSEVTTKRKPGRPKQNITNQLNS